MQKVLAVVFCLLYIAGVLVGVPRAGPSVSPWFLAVWSAVFVGCYIFGARGSWIVAISVVVIATLVLPFAALAAIAWPIYHSWPAMLGSFYGAFQERGLLGLVEFFAPVVAAALCSLLISQYRSNGGRASPPTG